MQQGKRFILGTLVASLSLPIWAKDTVEYQVDLTNPEHHRGLVTIEFPAPQGDYLDVQMPAWRTGLYRILDLANGVRHFQAEDENGQTLNVEKTDKSTWRIQANGGDSIQVSYEVYANQLGRRSRHIDDSHAYLDASAVFMYATEQRALPIRVELDVPKDWRSVSGMESDGDHAFVAANWDVLLDSPIETGIHSFYEFEVEGREYEVLFWGQGNYDAKQTVADLQKLVQQGDSIWSSYPFERYVFMMHATDGAGGATEHLNSTVIQRPRYSFASRKDYLSFLSTASHEFVHTWNVKAYRPDGLVPYDYQQENYTDLLWIAEGSTSYFQDHLLVRADIMALDEYFSNLARGITGNLRKPGTEVMSVAESSFEAWSDEQSARAHNDSVNIYSEGALVSFALDIALIEQSGGAVTYRDVHDALYQRFDATEQGFNSADVLAILQELTDHDWHGWWQQHVESPVQLDFDALLASVGLELVAPETEKPWAGWRTSAGQDGVQLSHIERGSPAWNAGFTDGDYLIAFNSRRVTLERLADHMSELGTDDPVDVTYFRRDALGEKTIQFESRGDGQYEIKPVAEPSQAQQRSFAAWLGVEHPNAN